MKRAVQTSARARYAAYLVDRLASRGDLDHLRKNPKPQNIWDWPTVAKAMELAA